MNRLFPSSYLAIPCLMLATASMIAPFAAHAVTLAPVEEVTEVLHGVTVQDPYRYFENVKDPKVQAWLKEQGADARAQLDRIELRGKLEQRIAEISAATGDDIRSVTRMPGNQVYYLKRAKDEKQFKLVMRDGLQAPERVLVDPELDAKRTGVPHAINYFVPAWDGKHVAYGVSAGGSEDASLYILDVQSGKTVGEPIPRVHEALLGWLPDSKSLTFNQLKVLKPGDAESETYLDSKVMWLKLGAAAAEAKPVFGPTVTTGLGLARLDVGAIIFNPGSRWMIARTTDTTLPEGFLFVAEVADLDKPTVAWKKISSFDDKITEVELKGNDLYLLTHAGAPRNRVLKLDLRHPDLKLAREVATAPKDAVLEKFSLTHNALIGEVREGTSIVLRRYAAGDTQGKNISLPFKGAASVHHDPAHVYSDVLYTLSGWTQLPRTLLLKGNVSADAGLRVNPTMPNLPEVEVADVKLPSYDGALVPMTLLYKKGLKRDGSNPTLLNAYAAYGHSQTAGFSPAAMAWIEQGGVLAYANVRGSGVYGDDWYRAGFKATKSNTWKDGVACAEYLIAEGYATPKTLGIMGTSAGGIFVGRTVTTAPQLFAAAIFNVGIMDAVRAEDSANGITNISEYGSAKNPAEFPALLEMSTYHNIKDNTAYPAVMLVHGMNDPRVDVWHSAKTAARLQAATNSGKPILLRLDMQAGHGIGSTATQRYALSADIYSFLLWQMGKVKQADN
ncbi:prolyl oligopeptidase family serine peptidase [Collimonas sp.]|uniref:prolyl oligopeptidase family serine peptidase n=1 Tax=Collimonas sp. TaxID=1963772 RepID=UPI002BCE44EF|nr:prolyl oligopeptidase family serine peptidase [Collimonas sp.]HWW07520.1 prolyl oligopeptidase family serine peptidase [Collimonas sp.]